MPKRLTQDEWIERARAVHGDKYDYSRVEYVALDLKVIIGCRKHEIWFEQSGYSHITGRNCPECAKESIGTSLRQTTEGFIAKSKALFGGALDYSLVEYVGSNVPVKLICNTCKTVSSVKPRVHFCGIGCPVCARKEKSKHLRLSNQEFIRAAKEVHGEDYDYSLSDYTISRNTVKIVCNTCSLIFEQTANSHLVGKGCPSCSDRKRVENNLGVKELPSKEILESVFIYDKESGQLIRKHSGHLAGSIIGADPSKEEPGYYSVEVHGTAYMAHRLIWAMEVGYVPVDMEIDHENGDTLDNRLSNLRLVSKNENMINRRIGTNNKTGVMGVYYANDREKFRPSITKDKRRSYLGSFDTLEEAEAARKEAEAKLKFHENHGKPINERKKYKRKQ